MSRLRRILPPNESSLQHRRSPRRSAGSGRSESPHSENRRTSRKYAGNRTNDRSGTASAIVAPAAVRDVERRSLIALVLLVFDPVGRYRAHAAGRIFRDAAAQLDKSRSFRLEMNVRTLPQENFSYIDAEVPFVPHRMWVEPGSGRWRLEKQDGSP